METLEKQPVRRGLQRKSMIIGLLVLALGAFWLMRNFGIISEMAWDYIFSWQPMQMSAVAKQKAEEIAKIITDGLGGRGIFGVELFVKGDEVYFSEVSPRPHDTGMVTLITQSQSEFALHLRAVLGLPLGFTFYGDGASAAFKSEKDSCAPVIEVDDSLFSANSFVRVFGKPESHKGRRMAVALVFDKVEQALEQAKALIKKVKDA